MKKIIKQLTLFLAAAMALVGCKEEFEYVFAGKGPDMTIVSVTPAEMGGDLNFEVSLNDPDFALSTLTAKLYFDDAVVGETYIKIYTNEAGYANSGTYKGSIVVPFLANIPDGEATVKFEGVNVGQGLTVKEAPVQITRPKFDKLFLTLENGQKHEMKAADDYNFEVEADFDPRTKAFIETPVIAGTERTLKFGYGKDANGNNVVLEGSETYIPYSNSVKGYKITFNTKTFETGPFLTLLINGKESSIDGETYSAVLDLTQESDFKVEGYEPGFADWIIDPDYIEVVDAAAGTFKFLPIDGKYKVSFSFTEKYFRFEAMKSNTELATLNSDLTGAIWLIGGDCVGKPVNGKSSWNPEAGGICLAQHSPKVYQVTLVAGDQLNPNNVDMKFFHQKSWGGEFGGGSIVSESDLFVAGESDGNIRLAEGKFLTKGVAYTFIVDLTNAKYDASASDALKCTGAVMRVEYDESQVPDQPDQPAEYAINGTKMEMVNPDEYKVTLDLTQGQQMNITGINDINSYYIDPDYVDNATFKWVPVDGKYRINVYFDKKYAKFTRVKEDGSDATLAEGAIWLMGYGMSFPYQMNEVNWETANAYCTAEISPKVYQCTGKAVKQKDPDVPGGKFRFDYWSIKYFADKSWGDAMHKDIVEFAGNSADNLKMGDNIELASPLEEGATYRLTIDLSQNGKEVVSLDKL